VLQTDLLDLQKKTVGELRIILKKKNVDLTGCRKKQEFIELSLKHGAYTKKYKESQIGNLSREAPILVYKDEIELTKEDIKRLEGNNLLNDSIIDFWFR